MIIPDLLSIKEYEVLHYPFKAPFYLRLLVWMLGKIKNETSVHI